MAEHNSDGGATPPRLRVDAKGLVRLIANPKTLVDRLLLAIALAPPRAHHRVRGDRLERQGPSRLKPRRE